MGEKWKEYYNNEQLRMIQAIELQNLKVFIDVCKELKLEYFLYGGTLLGAVKYNGFIPWDDDIDVALPRDSYERFIVSAPQILPEGYVLQSPLNCKRTPYPYTKLRKCGTKYIEYVHRKLPIETGIYIDIYPVDQIPDNELLRKKQFKSVRRWNFIYVCRQARLYDKKENTLKGHLKNIARFIVCHLFKVFPQKYCIDRMNYHMRKYNGTSNKRFAALNSPNYHNIYESIFPLCQGTFEEVEVNLPKDYICHLQRRYGDYANLPPEDERVGHIPYKLDFGDL